MAVNSWLVQSLKRAILTIDEVIFEGISEFHKLANNLNVLSFKVYCPASFAFLVPEICSKHAQECKLNRSDDDYLIIPHVRDMLIRPDDRYVSLTAQGLR